MLYQIFSRREASFEMMRKHLGDYVTKEGAKLVEDEKLKPDQLVLKLIELRERMALIQTQAMKKDTHVEMTLKWAFEHVVNQSNRTARSLVLYLDEMFKKEFKTINEVEINDKIDRVI